MHGGKIDGGIFTDRGMRAAAGFHPRNAFRDQSAGTRQEFRIFARVDIIRDHRDIVMVAHMFTEAIHQRGFAGPNRATNANAKRAMLRCAHDLNNLVYCVS